MTTAKKPTGSAKASYTYDYPRPALTVDCVVFGFEVDEHEPQLKLMLIERDIEPFEGRWALPGGFVRMDETLEAAAKRELEEEAGLKEVFLEQLYTFGALERDPRGRVISVTYMGLVRPSVYKAQASTDARDARWISLDQLQEQGPLAFDHEHIVHVAIERLRAKIRYKPVGFELLPEHFTLSQLQQLYEVILGHPVDKRNFQRKIHKTGLLVDTGQVQQNVAHRAARFYAFDWARYSQLERDGFEFAI